MNAHDQRPGGDAEWRLVIVSLFRLRLPMCMICGVSELIMARLTIQNGVGASTWWLCVDHAEEVLDQVREPEQ